VRDRRADAARVDALAAWIRRRSRQLHRARFAQTVPAKAEPLTEVRGPLRAVWNAEAELVAQRDARRLDVTGQAAAFAARLAAELGATPRSPSPSPVTSGGRT
jgi:hypothetical protein